jgi:hypothetical protein
MQLSKELVRVSLKPPKICKNLSKKLQLILIIVNKNVAELNLRLTTIALIIFAH